MKTSQWLLLLLLITSSAQAGSFPQEAKKAYIQRCSESLYAQGMAMETASLYCSCITEGIDSKFTREEVLALLDAEPNPEGNEYDRRLYNVFISCNSAQTQENNQQPNSVKASILASALFIPTAFVFSLLLSFILGLLNLLGFGIAALPGIGGDWVSSKLGISPAEDSPASKFNTFMYIFTWAGPIYLMSQLLIIGLYASGVTVFTGLFISWFPGAETTLQVLAFIWLWSVIGFTGLIAYALLLSVLKIWLGSLGIFWSVLGLLF